MCVKAEEVEGNAEGSGPAAASLLQSQSCVLLGKI